jgi:DNA-binding LytR/AlgR family response regulator
MSPPRALVADDEPLLRERLRAHLAQLWPELEVVAEARNGREAIEHFDAHAPDVVFLDVQMPGLNGVEAARAIARRAQIVFVTAYEQYAVQAFAHGAIDYLVKPFDPERLADTVQRLRARLGARMGAEAGPATDAAAAEPTGASARFDEALERVAAELARRAPVRRHLQWIRASVGSSVRLIPVEQVVYLRSDEKYTLVVHEGGEALIRRTIRELADELDPEAFAQVHRSVIVNLRHVVQLDRGPNETAELRLKGRPEPLPVSRSYLHRFRQM